MLQSAPVHPEPLIHGFMGVSRCLQLFIHDSVDTAFPAGFSLHKAALNFAIAL